MEKHLQYVRNEKNEKNKNIEVTISKYYVVSKSPNLKPLFKVTRKYSKEGINDTKFFSDVNRAKEQFKKWKS